MKEGANDVVVFTKYDAEFGQITWVVVKKSTKEKGETKEVENEQGKTKLAAAQQSG